jgi:hypothetical protein
MFKKNLRIELNSNKNNTILYVQSELISSLTYINVIMYS